VKTLRFALIATLFATAAWADEADIPAVWKAKCESCHGADGKAQTKQGKKHKIEDMTTADWQTNWTDEKMKKIIIEGSKDKKEMKPFKNKLSDAEIDGLIKHIRSFKG
jgi:cytochrome c553